MYKRSDFAWAFLLARLLGLSPVNKKIVTLVAFGGNRFVPGLDGLTDGSQNDPEVKAKAWHLLMIADLR